MKASQNMFPLRRPRRPARPAGFTLIELIVVTAMMGVFAVVFFGVFTFNVEASRVQSQISDMQQNLRVAQHDVKRFARMAGRGGLPAMLPGSSLPDGVAISVQNNVPAGTRIGGAGSPEVLEGTDILTIRGVFTNPVYQLTASPADYAAGVLEFIPQTPTGQAQDIGALAEAVQRALDSPGDAKEPLVLISPLGQYSIFALQTGSIVTTGGVNPEPLQIFVEIAEDAGYRALLVEGGTNPVEMTTVSSVGIIEEYRYYIRKVEPTPGRVTPRLTRARFYAGTNQPHPTNPNADEDIADHIVDLQIALGVDRYTGTGGGAADGLIYDGEPDDAADADEWLFNHRDDEPLVAGLGNLELLRLSILARTSRADRRYGGRRLAWLEDHDYVNGPVSPAATDLQRRRRMSQTVVNLRNL